MAILIGMLFMRGYTVLRGNVFAARSWQASVTTIISPGHVLYACACESQLPCPRQTGKIPCSCEGRCTFMETEVVLGIKMVAKYAESHV